MTEQETAELVRLAAKGDELAWRQLVDRLGPVLHHVSATYRLGEAEAADAVASTWLKLVEHIGSLRDCGVVLSWLVTTLRRECIARARTGGRERPVADFIGVYEPVETVDFDRRLVCADRQRLLQKAFLTTGLSQPQRRLMLTLFADPSPSYTEISARLGMPVGSIGPTRSRLLGRLREALPEGAAAMVG